MQNLAVQALVNSTECLINQQNNPSRRVEYSHLDYWNSKQERTKRKDQPWRRLATKNKIAQKAGYNLPNYSEKRTIAELLNQYGEFSYLTGKHLGTYYLSTLDLDLRKEEFPERLINYLEKSVKKLTNFLQVSYDKTKKGLHVDILTSEPLPNEIIYWTDKLGKKWTIGSIQSLGKYVVGEDPHKHFIKNGKWYWITKNNEEVKTILNQFFFYLSNQEKEVKKSIEITKGIRQKTFPYEAWNSLTKKWEKRLGFWSEKKQKIIPIYQDFNKSTAPQFKHTIRAKILSKEKIAKLADIWKVFYLEQKSQRTGYFLFNNYTQKSLTDLSIGAIKNIRLIQGRKHAFFSKFLL